MCAEAGADLIGLNFYPKSPRYVTRETGRGIALALKDLPSPPILVGVFVNEPVEVMKSVLDECRLDLAQLSGDEPGEVLETMHGRGFKAIRNYQLPITTNKRQMSQDGPDVLLDAQAAGQYGGTGKMADWESAARIATRCRLLLAGGLTPENVAAAVARVRPWGVDVASGVESSPGVKDREKVIRFIRNAGLEN